MNEQGVLLLVGVEAQQLKDRLEVSGYTTLEWGAGDRTIAPYGQQPMAAIVSPGQMPQVGQLRQWFGALPILLGVNEDSIEARELCFSSGADDFWLSRSAPSDLLQRLRLHLSLQKRKEEHCSVVVGDLQLETASGLVRRGTRLIGLTERESSLLLLLFKQRGKVVSREQILREVWNDEQGMSSNVVEVYIRYLRQKLEEGGDTRLIHTIRGRGYCLNHGVPFLKSS
jgi:DNA-binding response OmpR family regulator